MKRSINDVDRLEENEEHLIQKAMLVRERAYAPYSGFKVGAALMCQDGRVVVGCNLENVSFGATLCAERSALAQAIAEGSVGFEKLVVVCDMSPPASPCGICRQVLSEFCDDLSILLANPHGEVLRTRLKKLLPEPFSKIEPIRKKKQKS